MDCELPKEFDVIVVGTGMVESIVSAAASRIGKKVLQIDSNNYYGGYWASFNLDAILKLPTSKLKNVSRDSAPTVETNETIYNVGNDNFNLKNFATKWYIPEKNEKQFEKQNEEQKETEEKVGEKKDNEIENPSLKLYKTKDELLKQSRKFNIDLVPKLQFARGDLVELLISSNIARYSEYRSVSRVLTWLNGQLEIVPCSRSDVFANNRVSVIEKRMLMKLLTSLNESEDSTNEHENKTFQTFLKEKKLTPNLIHYVLYAISMSNNETLYKKGIENTKRFLNSLGRFGKTPFLFSMYGSGEITQAFCRLSAVFGGVFALYQPINGLVFDKDKRFKSLISGKNNITAEHLIIGIENVPNEFLKSVTTKTYISRAVFICDKSILISEKEHLTLLLYPPENGKHECTIIECGTLTGVCPTDLHVVHMIAKQTTNPEEDFQHCVSNLFSSAKESESNEDGGKPEVLWSCYFSIPDSNDINLQTELPDNVFVCPGPDLDLDYDLAIKKGKQIFLSICPDCEFLPRAPDPEEIVIEGDNENEDGTSGTVDITKDDKDDGDKLIEDKVAGEEVSTLENKTTDNQDTLTHKTE